MTSKIIHFIDRHEFIAVFITMIISSLILSFTFWNTYPLHTTTDELGAIVGAATLAGYDWGDVINNSGYYGFGYYSIFAPLFALHLSPIFIYRFILIFTRFFRGFVISGISYYIGRKYLLFESKLLLIGVSIMCTIPLHVYDAANIINDVILDIFLWIVILLVCKIYEYNNNAVKSTFCIFLYLLTSFYIYFLHTRAVVIVISSGIVVLGILIFTRKYYMLLTFLSAPLYVIAKSLIGDYQNFIWSNTESLANTTVSISKGISIFDPKVLQIWGTMIIGHISVQSIITGGLFWIAIIACSSKMIACLRKKDSVTPYEIIIIMISLMCMGAVFAAFMKSSWITGMYETWGTDKMGKTYPYKALCYVRYWNVFGMPFTYMGAYYIFNKSKNKIVDISLICILIDYVLFMKIVVPIISTNSSAASFLFSLKTNRHEKTNNEFYYKCILISLGITIIFYVIYRVTQRHIKYSIIPIFSIIVVGYCFGNYYFNEDIRERISSMVLSSYYLKCELVNSDVDIGNIYAIDDRVVDHNWEIYAVLQFYLYEYRIETDLPEELAENDVIITTEKNDEIEETYKDINCYTLDDNEVWYTKMNINKYGSRLSINTE